MIITIMKSLGEALLVDKIISQIKSPDANCEGRFILYITFMSLRGRLMVECRQRRCIETQPDEAIPY